MTNDQIIQHSQALAPSLGRIQYLALVVGLLGIGGAVVGYSSHPDQFFQSYLLSYVSVSYTHLTLPTILLV